MIRATCRELGPLIGDLDANHAAIIDAISGATADGAQVVVLPELATSGYCFTSPEEARSLAIGVDDPRIREWSSAISGDGVAVVGFAELGEDGAVYNSAVMLDSDGILAVHRKVHLWDREHEHFTAGAALPPVVATRHGSIGMLICYDLEFPEYTRLTALAGAQLLAVPVNWPLFERPEGERPGEVTIAQAAARVNRVAIVCCDRARTERGQEWTRGTSIVDHNGWLVAGVGGDRSAELDLAATTDKRLTEHADLFADRRTDVYALGRADAATYDRETQ